ncbi:MAG TPA: hypothetical protein VMQ51_13715 [Candidatus Binatia bacterium]|nr:hypothetical protein [Candidatus Binatia bacterium]
MELLPREEVALLLGGLTACGFLVLGILDVLWPPVSRRRAGPRASSPAPAAPPAPALPPAPPERPLAPLPPPPSALSVGRTLLERARVEIDLERRVTILTRAVAGMSRAVQAAPADTELAATLTSSRAFLWETWEKIALARLAAAMPWGASGLSAPPREGHIAALSRTA